MSPAEAPSEAVTAPEDRPGTVEADRPLSLGDALTFTPDPLRGHVVVEAVRPVVFIGPLGLAALRDWLACTQENSQDELELWTASGIAKETGTARGTVYKWIERDDFPRRFAHPVGGAPVWEADQVRAWLLTSRPQLGRPKAS